jgi:hypothetical protein
MFDVHQYECILHERNISEIESCNMIGIEIEIKCDMLNEHR